MISTMEEYVDQLKGQWVELKTAVAVYHGRLYRNGQKVYVVNDQDLYEVELLAVLRIKPLVQRR